MIRRKPLPRRTKPIPKRRAKARRSERVRDIAYLSWLHDQPCFVRVVASPLPADWDCDGPIEADHVGVRPMGRKSNDADAISLCRKHHHERHLRTGYFSYLLRDEMRAWCKVAIDFHQRAWGARPTVGERR